MKVIAIIILALLLTGDCAALAISGDQAVCYARWATVAVVGVAVARASYFQPRLSLLFLQFCPM